MVMDSYHDIEKKEKEEITKSFCRIRKQVQECKCIKL